MGKMLKVCNIYCAKSTAFQWHQHKEKKKGSCFYWLGDNGVIAAGVALIADEGSA